MKCIDVFYEPEYPVHKVLSKCIELYNQNKLKEYTVIDGNGNVLYACDDENEAYTMYFQIIRNSKCIDFFAEKAEEIITDYNQRKANLSDITSYIEELVCCYTEETIYMYTKKTVRTLGEEYNENISHIDLLLGENLELADFAEIVCNTIMFKFTTD